MNEALDDAKQAASEVAADLAATEAAAALAKLAAEVAGLQRQLDRISLEVRDSEDRGTRLTDAKFVTYRTLIDSQAEKVALALGATSTAIDKAERATEKAIDKAEAANDKRFESVNEFRAQLTDLIARFATLERVDLLYNQTNQRMNEMAAHNELRMGDMTIRLTKIEEYARGAQGNKAGIYAAIGAAVGLIAIIVFVANIMTNN